MDVAQVNLHKRECRGQQSIPEGNGGVGVGSGVDQDAINLLGGCRLNAVHQSPLMVALDTPETDAPLLSPGHQLSVNLRQGGPSVNTGLTGSQ